VLDQPSPGVFELRVEEQVGALCLTRDPSGSARNADASCSVTFIAMIVVTIRHMNGRHDRDGDVVPHLLDQVLHQVVTPDPHS
jgi:hypothetical protein